MIKKLLAGAIIATIGFSTTFAYDLTKKDIAKGEKITKKVIQLLNTKSEEKKEAFKTKILYALNAIKPKVRKNEKNLALVEYVINKIENLKEETSSGIVLQYPGCTFKDIALNNGQIWSACDIGTTAPGKEGEQFAYGSNYGYKNPGAISNKKGVGTDWSETDTQGPCADGYHIPSKQEFEKAIVATKENGGIVKILDINGDYFVTTIEKSSYPVYFSYTTLGNTSNWVRIYNIVGYYNKIRCIKD